MFDNNVITSALMVSLFLALLITILFLFVIIFIFNFNIIQIKNYRDKMYKYKDISGTFKENKE